MTREELDVLVSREEKLLKVGSQDFQKRHDTIIEEIERIKGISRNTGEYKKNSD